MMNSAHTQIFEDQRASLISLAYQMLGERGMAEDIVQEAWVKWCGAERDSIKTPAAWLRQVTSRLAIDALRSARHQREQYIGPWLPEPMLADDNNPEDALHLARECELALLWAMERLTPVERSAFILRNAFDSDYAEIAQVLGKSEDNCRKIVSRATRQVRDSKLRFSASADETAAVLAQFSKACLAVDHAEVLKLMAPDVVAISDGGGRVRAALRPLHGADEVTQVIIALAGKFISPEAFSFTRVNGRPACMIRGTEENDMISTIHVNADGLIDWIYIMRNPDKLPIEGDHPS